MKTFILIAPSSEFKRRDRFTCIWTRKSKEGILLFLAEHYWGSNKIQKVSDIDLNLKPDIYLVKFICQHNKEYFVRRTNDFPSISTRMPGCLEGCFLILYQDRKRPDTFGTAFDPEDIDL